MQGRVIQSTGSWYEVRTEQGTTISCRLKGKFRLQDQKLTNPVAVGDVVTIEADNEGSSVIAHIEPRKNYLVREAPQKKAFTHIIAANIDQVLVVATLHTPRTSHGFIDRVLFMAEVYGIPAHIVFHKCDLYNSDDQATLELWQLMYQMAGYPSICTSVVSGEQLDALGNILSQKITLLTGHSGVGKSSLINAVEPSVFIKTGELSAYHQKGQHTTTFARMFPLSKGGYIVDTPGIKEFGMVHVKPEEAGHYFPEIRNLLHGCRFNNCQHINELHCAVRDAVNEGTLATERYISYLSIYDELKYKNPW